MLVVTSLLLVAVSPIFLVLHTITRVQNQVQQASLAVQDAGVGVAKMMHTVRQAYSVLAATPSSIEINVAENGVQRHVGFYCGVSQPGTTYSECVRVQAAVGAALPAPSSGVPVVLRVQNGSIATYCNPDGTYSASVFHFANAANPNTGTACTEAGVDAASIAPTLVQATLNLPAGGELSAAQGALGHSIAVRSAAYMRNLDV